MSRRGRVAGYIGMASFALGVLILYLGYNGASKNPIVEAQVPYLISGGLFGAALMIVGAISYAASLILRSLPDTPPATAPQAEVTAVVDVVASSAEGARNGASKAEVYIAGGGTSFHDPTCRLVERASEVRGVSREEAVSIGLSPCRVCGP
ncbi:MAG: hypothetical protein ACLGH3_08980 [Actinomycetota bacterium]